MALSNPSDRFNSVVPVTSARIAPTSARYGCILVVGDAADKQFSNISPVVSALCCSVADENAYLSTRHGISMNPLADLGLSGYEEQAYRALLTTGAASARTVAERSGVPDGRIYDVLNGLVARGLVSTQAGDPRQYTPVEPTAAIDQLLSERVAEIEAAEARYRQLAAQARSTLAPTPPVDAGVWLADLGDEDATVLAGEQISATDERFVMAVGPPYVGAPQNQYRSEITAFIESVPTEITVDLLLDHTIVDDLSTELETLRQVGADITIRHTPQVTVTFDVVDSEAAYIDVPQPFGSGQRFGFLEVRDSLVAARLERGFDAVWQTATPVPL